MKRHGRGEAAVDWPLADVVPEGGEVILSLHYLAGLKATPSRVKIEKVEREPSSHDPTGHDPIGFIRLKLTDPAPRVTLTWDRR